MDIRFLEDEPDGLLTSGAPFFIKLGPVRSELVRSQVREYMDLLDANAVEILGVLPRLTVDQFQELAEAACHRIDMVAGWLTR